MMLTPLALIKRKIKSPLLPLESAFQMFLSSAIFVYQKIAGYAETATVTILCTDFSAKFAAWIPGFGSILAATANLLHELWNLGKGWNSGDPNFHWCKNESYYITIL